MASLGRYRSPHATFGRPLRASLGRYRSFSLSYRSVSLGLASLGQSRESRRYAMTISIRRICPGLVAVATICLGLVPARPAAAAAAVDTVIRLVGESATVATDGSATFSIEVTDAPPDAVIALDVYLPVNGDRAAVAAAMQGKVRGQQFFPGLRLPADTTLGPDHRVTLTVPTSSDGHDGTFRLKTAGLYPVLISVQKGSVTLARLTTFLVRVDPTSRPVEVAMVFPVDRAPVLQPDGSRILDEATRSRLNTIDRIGATAPTVPLTLAIRPDIIDTLVHSTADDRALAGRLATIAKRGEVIVDTAITIDPSLAARSGLSDIYKQQVAQGKRILSDWVGSEIADSGTRFSSVGIDRDGLKLARAGGLTTLLTLPAVVTRVGSDDIGPLGPVSITVSPIASADVLPGVVGANDFATLIRSRSDPLNAVNGFVAQLQALSPAPSATLPGVVLVAPLDWSAEAGGPLDTLVARLGGSGGLRPVTVQQFRRDVPTVKTLRTFREVPPVAPVDVGGQLALVNLGIGALTSMMPTPPPETNALLNVASSTALTDIQRAAYIAAAKAPTDAMQTAIDPLEKQTFSVAAGKGAIPIRITSKLSAPINVKLHFSSARADFVPNDQIVTIIDGLFQKDDMPIETRDGLYPVKLEVLTPVGDQLLATGVYDVQAIAYGGLGLALSAGAGLVLVTWWISHARRTRRRKRALADALRHPSRAATG